ncbi:MAG: lipoyl(octanoyl) transferase LipB [bacterium]
MELGSVEYGRALEFQRALVRLRQSDDIPDTLVLLEHPPTFTMGKSGNEANLLVSEAELRRRGASIHRIERGGDVTFHGPGQLVGYPVFKLTEELVGVRRFIEGIEAALVSALAELGVAAETKPGAIGVWTGGRKVASLGVAVSRRVTFHGFALNVTTDLSWFGLANPCGLSAAVMTSIEREGGRTGSAEVRSAVRGAFAAGFGLEYQRNLPRSLTELTKGLSDSAIDSASASV